MQPFSPSKLVIAYAIDIAAGDPPGMPHPVRLMGAAYREANVYANR